MSSNQKLRNICIFRLFIQALTQPDPARLTWSQSTATWLQASRKTDVSYKHHSLIVYYSHLLFIQYLLWVNWCYVTLNSSALLFLTKASLRITVWDTEKAGLTKEMISPHISNLDSRSRSKRLVNFSVKMNLPGTKSDLGSPPRKAKSFPEFLNPRLSPWSSTVFHCIRKDWCFMGCGGSLPMMPVSK